MSQQINLLLPELRPRFDWLGLPVVTAAGLAGLLLVAGLAGFASLRIKSLAASEQALRSQVASVQQQVVLLGQKLGARQGDTTLEGQLAAARTAVAQRQEVLNRMAQGDLMGGQAYSSLLQGFSRQIVPGVWLTGFSFADKHIEMRGRLTDPALLPVYIGRLNHEPVFAGRRFAALDMQGVDPKAEAPEAGAAGRTGRAPLPRFTEFALRTAAERAK
ncbi:MAG: hypothetical protein ACK4FP_05625 [Azonexus sp.]